MVFRHAKRFATTTCVAGLLLTTGYAQCEETRPTESPSAQKARVDIEQIRQELAKQRKALEAQQRILDDQEKKLATQKQELEESRRRLEALLLQIGGESGAASASKAAKAEPSPDRPVGQRPQPSADSNPPAVAPIFEQPGVLTPRGRFVLEPSLQYSYSSAYRVALVGYTVIPAIHIGLIDIRGVNDSTWIAGLSARYGLSNRLEIEAKVPYVYRTEAAVTRGTGSPSSVDSVFDTSGKGLGDVEVSARYQLNEGGENSPYYIAGLRVKARNGKDSFSVPYSDNYLPLELPTGSGFWAIQPSLAFIYPSDPAVFFGGVNYVKNIDRDVGDGRGTVHPGNAVGLNFGMGLALNERASFSLGFDHTWVGKPSATGGTLLFPAATTTQLSTLLFGYSYRLSDSTSLNFSVGAGLTPETPGVQVMLRIPIMF